MRRARGESCARARGIGRGLRLFGLRGRMCAMVALDFVLSKDLVSFGRASGCSNTVGAIYVYRGIFSYFAF
jgi:hypothetical protein